MLQRSQRMRAEQVGEMFKKSFISHGPKASLRISLCNISVGVGNVGVSGNKPVDEFGNKQNRTLWSVIVSKKVAKLAVERNRIRRVWYETIRKLEAGAVIKNDEFSEQLKECEKVVVMPKAEFTQREREEEIKNLIINSKRAKRA